MACACGEDAIWFILGDGDLGVSANSKLHAGNTKGGCLQVYARIRGATASSNRLISGFRKPKAS